MQRCDSVDFSGTFLKTVVDRQQTTCLGQRRRDLLVAQTDLTVVRRLARLAMRTMIVGPANRQPAHAAMNLSGPIADKFFPPAAGTGNRRAGVSVRLTVQHPLQQSVAQRPHVLHDGLLQRPQFADQVSVQK